MPNWVKNELSFRPVEREFVESKDKNAVILEVLQAIQCTGETQEEHGLGTIDFNKIIPMPESLNMPSGSEEDYSIAIYLTNKLQIPHEQTLLENYISNRFSLNWPKEVVARCREENYSEEEMDRLYELGKQYVSNKDNYGSTTWYDWCNKNWGTKWNASGCGFSSGCLYFQTAWSTPEPIVKQLSKMFKDVYFKCSYADEDYGSNCGWYTYFNGEIVDFYTPTGERAIDFALKIWGEDEDGSVIDV